MAVMAGPGLVAVTGVTGELGGRVAARLARDRHDLRLLARDPGRAPHLPGATVVRADYADVDGLHAALRGVDALLLVPAGRQPDRVGLHTGAVDAAVRAGVGRIVYMSLLTAAPDATCTFARDHWHTERHIAATGLPYTFLRDSLYLDRLPRYVGDDGVLRAPAGDGRVAAVTRDDIADVAAAVLVGNSAGDAVHDVTGPVAFTMRELVEQLSRASGRTVRYQPESVEDAYPWRLRTGAPRWLVDGWVSTWTAIAAGEFATVADAVPRLTGHPATGLADFLRLNPGVVDHLRAR
jgi:NAD(P)H dehydrogenase (quinone)